MSSWDSAPDGPARFWSKVDTTGDCWEWTAALTGAYGKFHLSKEMGLTFAHRYSYFLHTGHQPATEEHVLHSCDNGKCVNPRHLRLGTNAENVADRVARGRSSGGSRLGERHASATISEAQAREIKRLLADGMSRPDVVRQLGVSRGAVRSIHDGASWKWVA